MIDTQEHIIPGYVTQVRSMLFTVEKSGKSCGQNYLALFWIIIITVRKLIQQLVLFAIPSVLCTFVWAKDYFLYFWQFTGESMDRYP